MPDPQIHRRRWWILAVLIVSLFTVNLDNTILNVALPTLARDLGASISELQWMIDAYVLAFAGLLLAAGAIGDRFGRRRVLTVGLVIFGVGSFASAFAGSAGVLIPLRALMGVGGALITPSTLSVTRAVFTLEERPKAIAIWTATAGLGIVAGPVIAGLLLDRFAWGSIFLINIPVVLVGLAGTRRLVPETSSPDAPALDVAGALVSIAALGALVYGTIEAPARGWTDPAILASFGAFAVLLPLFVVLELRSSHPMLDVRIFRRPELAAGSLAILLSSLGMMGSMFFLSQYLQSVVGLTTLETGFGVIPLALALGVASPVAALAWRRIGARAVAAVGLGCVALGLFLMAHATVSSGYPLVAATLALVGGGMALAATPVTTLMITAMPASRAGIASAINSTARELGGALGVAILGSVAAPVYATRIEPVARALPPQAAEPARDSVAGALAVASMLPHDLGSGLTLVARTAFVDGMSAAVTIGAVIALAGAAVALAFLPGRARRNVQAPAAALVVTQTRGDVVALPDASGRAA